MYKTCTPDTVGAGALRLTPAAFSHTAVSFRPNRAKCNLPAHVRSGKCCKSIDSTSHEPEPPHVVHVGLTRAPDLRYECKFAEMQHLKRQEDKVRHDIDTGDFTVAPRAALHAVCPSSNVSRFSPRTFVPRREAVCRTWQTADAHVLRRETPQEP